jgi:hypothetical protein
MRAKLYAISLLLVGGSVSACNCEGDPLLMVHNKDAQPADDAEPNPDAQPNPPDAEPAPDAAPAPDAGECQASGIVTGRVCAPQQRDWIAGAMVTLNAMDCHGNAVTLSATSGMDGSFTINNVPAGSWTVTAVAGMFMTSYMVNVQDGQTTTIPPDQLCLNTTPRIAVVTGSGDHIETLLTNLGITPTIFDGTTNWATAGSTFLANLNQMKMYDLIFIDCGAAKTRVTDMMTGNMVTAIDLGSNASTIVQNLQQYVMGGGSIYASDWAVAFLAMAFPQQVQPHLMGGGSVAMPMVTNNLDGYAPQTINAMVTDMPLATALQKQTVSITFPDQSGARSYHWGLLDMPSQARILVQGPASTCAMGAMTCDHNSMPGPSQNAPLAIGFKLTPMDQRGGNVYYTSFHNIAQTGNDVANVLKYIIFHL